MILKFTLKTDRDFYPLIAKRVAKEVGVKIGISKDEENFYIYVDGDEEQIEDFSKKLSYEFPLSIFLEKVFAEVVDEFKDEYNQFVKRVLPPCPKCIQEVKNKNSKNYYNPFYHCEICGYIDKNAVNWKSKFKELADKLKEKGSIVIQTMNGVYEVTTNLEDVEEIVAVDLQNVIKYFMIFEGDEILASIEKPMIKLNTNLNFKKEFANKNAYFVKLPDCMVLELLCEEVKELKLLGLKKAQKAIDLDFEIKNPYSPLKIVIANKKALVYEGDRSLLPKIEKFITDKFAGKYKEYVAYPNQDKTIIDKKEINLEKKEAKEVFAGFFGVLYQYNLSNKNVVGFSFYKNSSKFLIYSSKFGLVEYMNFEFNFQNADEVFNLISKMNDTGERLIKNFKEKRKNLYKSALNANFNSSLKGIAYLWGVIGVILGFGSSIDEGFEKLVNFASETFTKKGVRIDYKAEKNNLNPLWAIRTSMSFNLAGVDNYILSYGVIESFAEFLSNQYDLLDKENKLNGAIIVGDLFKETFLEKLYIYISKNHKVYLPKSLAVSGAIESFGSLVIYSLKGK